GRRNRRGQQDHPKDAHYCSSDLEAGDRRPAARKGTKRSITAVRSKGLPLITGITPERANMCDMDPAMNCKRQKQSSGGRSGNAVLIASVKRLTTSTRCFL